MEVVEYYDTPMVQDYPTYFSFNDNMDGVDAYMKDCCYITQSNNGIIVDINKPVMLKMFYSHLRKLWCNHGKFIRYPFPMVAITPEEFITPDDGCGKVTYTPRSIGNMRAGGYTYYDEEYMSIIGLGINNSRFIFNGKIIKQGELVNVLHGDSCYSKINPSALPQKYDIKEMVGINEYKPQVYRLPLK